MAASGRRSTFAFDLSKPLKKGTLLKQGALHKAFKHRFFVLYPGFLVYYDDATKWKLDMTRGETLGVSCNFESADMFTSKLAVPPIVPFCGLSEVAGGSRGEEGREYAVFVFEQVGLLCKLNLLSHFSLFFRVGLGQSSSEMAVSVLLEVLPRGANLG